MNLQIFGRIVDFEKKLATTRSRGINIFMIFQNIAQLKNRYDNDVWQEILGNCDTKICMGCRRYFNSRIYYRVFTVQQQWKQMLLEKKQDLMEIYLWNGQCGN